MVSLICLGTLLFSSWVIGRRVIEQIQRTKKLVQSLSKSNLTLRMEVTERDEIGLLTVALNETSQNLYTLTLDNKIGEGATFKITLPLGKK